VFETLTHPFRHEVGAVPGWPNLALRLAGAVALATLLFSLLYCFVKALD
jgi:hypothetical protein